MTPSKEQLMMIRDELLRSMQQRRAAIVRMEDMMGTANSVEWRRMSQIINIMESEQADEYDEFNDICIEIVRHMQTGKLKTRRH